MTRETKVGLVVGTGIILLIGIVVSDHLASQQRGQQQTAAPTGYQDYTTGAPTRTIDPRNQVRPPADTHAGTSGNTVAPLPPGGAARGNNIGNGQRTEAIGLNNIDRGSTPPAGNTTAQPGGAQPGGAVIDRNLTDALNSGNTPGSITGNTGNSGNTIADGTTRTPDTTLPPGLSTDLGRHGFLPQDNTPRLSNPTGGVTDSGRSTGNGATQPLIHHVQPGESLWAISQRFYGDGKHYADIARANADKLLPDGGVREGVRLLIPNKTIAAPGPVMTVDGSASAITDRRIDTPIDRPHNDGASRTVPSTPALRTIKVEPGDALSTIASRELGSIRHMQLIIEANRDQINDANDIKAGMTLKIPAIAASGTTGSANNASPVRSLTESTTTRAVKTYTVQPRDTFSSIARTRLGDERRWKELFDLNKGKVRSADALKPGVVISLPADAR